MPPATFNSPALLNNHHVLFAGGCDLAFMVDASSSIGGEANFRLVMNFVTRVFHAFPRNAGVRHGLVVFGSHVEVPPSLMHFY